MVGGDDEPVDRLEPAFTTLAPENGWAHVGPGGAGHYVKMVHNGIEYGMMQAYAEGFELCTLRVRARPPEHRGDLAHGSVVRSWLLELLHDAFERTAPSSRTSSGYVEDSGEGRWTVERGIDEAFPLPVIAAALFARFASRTTRSTSPRRLPPRCATSSAATRSRDREGRWIAPDDPPQPDGRPPRQHRRTRSSRGCGCGARPSPARSSSSARPATSPSASSSRRSTSSRSGACCREQFAIVGVARSEETDEEFRERDEGGASRSTRETSSATTSGTSFAAGMCYVATDFADDDGEDRAARALARSTRSAAPRATGSTTSRCPPSAFATLIEQLGERPRRRTAGRASSSRSRSATISSARAS